MLIATAPGALVWPAALIVWGPGSASGSHRHHCVQLVMALDGKLRVRGRPSQPWVQCGAALVRPDVDHEVDASDVPVLLAFVDAESELGAAFLERFAGEIACIPATRVAAWRAAVGGKAIDPASVERWVRRELPPGRRATRVDPRVRRVLTHLKSHPGDPEELALPRLAAVAGLSPSRLMHLFTKSVGVPPRPYVLWLRLQRAAGELLRGASVTQAAHEAGFADAAHLTRTFRRMLGTKPSEMARRRASSRGVAVESS